MKPYIGVCDFTAPEQSHRLLNFIPQNFSHNLMVGVMMSYKTLNNLPTKWAKIFPQKEDIASIFVDDPRVCNTLHYADYAIGAEADKALSQSLLRAVTYGGPFLDAIQLDMVWPDPLELAKFRKDADIPLVLQVGANAMRMCDDDPIVVCERLQAYGLTIDAVLFDKSMGKGLSLDVAVLAKYVGALVHDCPHLLPAVAGGLNAFTLYRVTPLVDAVPHLSIDAQSRLRRSGHAEDFIDWQMAEDYLRDALDMYT